MSNIRFQECGINETTVIKSGRFIGRLIYKNGSYQFKPKGKSVKPEKYSSHSIAKAAMISKFT